MQHKMDIGQLCSILAACMSTNPEQRKAGETTLEQVLSYQQTFSQASSSSGGARSQTACDALEAAEFHAARGIETAIVSQPRPRSGVARYQRMLEAISTSGCSGKAACSAVPARPRTAGKPAQSGCGGQPGCGHPPGRGHHLQKRRQKGLGPPRYSFDTPSCTPSSYDLQEFSVHICCLSGQSSVRTSLHTKTAPQGSVWGRLLSLK